MHPKDRFVETLFAASRLTKVDPELSLDVIQKFLEYGSESPDNISCSKHIIFGEGPESYRTLKRRIGLRLKKKNVFLSDIMVSLEDNSASRVVKSFPKLTTIEAEAALRMMTNVFLALEADLRE